jgi:hypothetical protein
VLAGAWVAALAASPGNCRAIWGLIDAEALMPPVDPVTTPVADPAGAIADGPVTFELGTFNGSVAQSCAGAAPMIDVPDVEQSVCVRPVPPGLACIGAGGDRSRRNSRARRRTDLRTCLGIDLGTDLGIELGTCPADLRTHLGTHLGVCHVQRGKPQNHYQGEHSFHRALLIRQSVDGVRSAGRAIL